MDFKWAAKQMEKGRKVRRPSWGIEVYYYFYNGKICIGGGVYKKDDDIKLTIEDISATDWELFNKKVDTNVRTVGNLIEVLQKLDEDMRVGTKKTYCVHVSETDDKVLIGDYK